MVDLGGGSTELVLGTTTPEAAFSMDVGCVRMTERHLRSDPPTAAEIAAAHADVAAALDTASAVVPLGKTVTLVGLAGTVTTVTAHGLGLPAYDPDVIDGSVLPVDVVLAACDDLLAPVPRGPGRAAASCTPAGSTSSAPARWCGRTSSVGCATRSPPRAGS